MIKDAEEEEAKQLELEKNDPTLRKFKTDTTLKKNGQFHTAAKEYGVDLQFLNSKGIDFDSGRRLQRCLYVHTTGFHSLIREVTKNCK